MTRIINLREHMDVDQIKEAAKSLKEGNLVIFPTETVYGIGANVYNEKAVKNIFKAKGRAKDNPLIVHVSDFGMMNNLVKKVNKVEQLLIDAFFPGPFTLILAKSKLVSDVVSAGLDTVGIRMPDNAIAHALIKEAGVPIAAPSANISSRPSGTIVNDIFEEFDDKVDIIIDGGPSEIGLESTVVRVIDNVPIILRPGKITPEDILPITGSVKISNKLFTRNKGAVLSPGMKHKHYAPNAKTILIYSDNTTKLNDEINKYKTNKTVVIGPDADSDNYLNYGNNLDEISHNIFHLLRKADEMKPDLIIIVGVKKEGLGIAIMNRLIRASEFNYIEI